MGWLIALNAMLLESTFSSLSIIAFAWQFLKIAQWVALLWNIDRYLYDVVLDATTLKTATLSKTYCQATGAARTFAVFTLCNDRPCPTGCINEQKVTRSVVPRLTREYRDLAYLVQYRNSIQQQQRHAH